MSVGVAGDLGSIAGIMLGTWFFSYLFSLIFRAITKIDSVKQKVIATTLSTILYISIIPWQYRKDGVNVVSGFIIFCLLAGLTVTSFFALRFKFKQFLVSLIYGIIFWIVLSNLIVLFLALLRILDMKYTPILSAVILGIAFTISTYLTFRQKLPFTGKFQGRNT